MFDLDLTDVSTETPFDILPDGVYSCYIDKAEIKTSENSGNKYINVMFKVFSGDKTGRVFFNMYNVFHHPLLGTKSKIFLFHTNMPKVFPI